MSLSRTLTGHPNVARRAGLFILVFTLYALGAQLSLRAALPHLKISLIWIPGGIALGFVYLFGAWLLPAIFLAVALVNVASGTNPIPTLGFAAANTASVGAIVFLLRRSRGQFHPSFKRSRDVLQFVLAALAGCVIGGMVAGLSLMLVAPERALFHTALHWSLAECLSIIAIAPFLLTNLTSPWITRRWGIERKAECALLTLLTCVLAYLVFLVPPERLGFFGRSSVLLPVLLWAGLRFNPRVISTYVMLLSIAAVAGPLLGRGAFFFGNLSNDLMEVQAYIGMLCVCSLLIASVSYERARLARDREENLRRLANAIPELVWTAETSGLNTYLNDRGYQYFGLAKNASAQEWTKHLHPEDAERTFRKWEAALRSGEAYEVEHRLRAGDGRYEWFLTKASPLRDENGQIQSWFGASMSVEQQRRAILELEEEKDIRDRMVFTLSHDIRNPLAVIDAGAQVLLKAPPPPDLARNFLQQISQNVQRANRMIVDLLDANRLRAGSFIALKLEPMELVGVLRETVDGLSTIHDDVFRLEAPAEVRGVWAADELRRITENLCVNAVKYGDPRRGVRISVHESGEAGDVSVCVHNFGSVIEEQDRARIFHLFHRTRDSLEGERKGWGIGLTLVQGFTAAHGGRVEVTSSAEGGTAFTVRLPRDSRAFAVRAAN